MSSPCTSRTAAAAEVVRAALAASLADPFVFAYRAYPPLLRAVATDPALEPTLAQLVASLETMGHRVQVVPKVAGGMNGVLQDPATGHLRGAACWRADGTPIGISGGPAWIAGGSLPGQE